MLRSGCQFVIMNDDCLNGIIVKSVNLSYLYDKLGDLTIVKTRQKYETHQSLLGFKFLTKIKYLKNNNLRF